MIRLRSMKTGRVTDLPTDMAVEITDLQGNVALLLMPDSRQAAVTLITATEEPERAANYAKVHRVQFSRLMAPDLSRLTTAPVPTPISR